jgi:hypothetical protein
MAEVAANMPGRTAKSLTHIWAQMKKEIEALGQGGGAAGEAAGASTIATPKKNTTPASAKRKKNDSDDAGKSTFCLPFLPA